VLNTTVNGPSLECSENVEFTATDGPTLSPIVVPTAPSTIAAPTSGSTTSAPTVKSNSDLPLSIGTLATRAHNVTGEVFIISSRILEIVVRALFVVLFARGVVV
jgi:hypothetical protein